MNPLSLQEKEDLRYAIREVLAVVPQTAFPLSVIHRRVEKLQLLDFTPAAEDVRNALAVLISLQQAQTIFPKLGATPHYQATAEGVLAHERRE